MKLGSERRGHFKGMEVEGAGHSSVALLGTGCRLGMGPGESGRGSSSLTVWPSIGQESKEKSVDVLSIPEIMKMFSIYGLSF